VSGVEEAAERIEGLIRAIEERADPATLDLARSLVSAVLELHAGGLARALELVAEAGGDGLARLAADPAVAALLALHGLHPDDLEQRVRGALVALGPELAVHGARAELAGAEGGQVRINLVTAPGCGGQAGTVRRAVEEALVAAAPDASAIEVIDASGEAAGFVPLTRLAAPARGPG
jgi:Fe-S cluster biogenesis protein NfuA